MKQLRPMLAEKCPEDLDSLLYPMFGSYKLDGVRALIVNGVVVSRKLKPIPNRHIQGVLGREELNGLDGELIVGSPTDNNCMQNTMSGVMSRDGHPDFRFYVFDFWNRQDDYLSSADPLIRLIESMNHALPLVAHHQVSILDTKHLIEYEGESLELGYEGVILRKGNSPYKFGRSTLKEGYLLKLKRFDTDEAIVIDAIELEHNDNILTQDELGFAKRSTHKAGMVKGGVLGALVVRQLTSRGVLIMDGPTFSVGGGFTLEQRKHLWSIKDSLKGKVITFKHFAKQGVKDAPRHTGFVSFRDPIDLQ